MASTRKRATRLKLLLEDLDNTHMLSPDPVLATENKRVTRNSNPRNLFINASIADIHLSRQAETKLKIATRHSRISIARTQAAYQNIFAIQDYNKQQVETLPVIPTSTNLCQGCFYSECDIISLLHTTTADSLRTNQTALNILINHGVIPNTLYCPKKTCNKNPMTSSDGRIYHCYKRYTFQKYKKSKKKRIQCRYSVSNFRGTFLENSHIGPAKLLLFINYWLRQNYNQRNVANNVEIDQKTCVFWKKKCDQACHEYLIKNGPRIIGGPGIVVEIDETIIYKDFSNVTGEDNRTGKFFWIFGGIERHSINYNAFTVPLAESSFNEELDREELKALHRDFPTLVSILLEHVRPGSIIISDGWAAYSKLGDPINGVIFYEHKVINHKNGFVLPLQRFIHTNNIERFWKLMKAYCKKPGNQLKNIWRYLARFTVLLMHKKKSRNQRESNINHVLHENRKIHMFLIILAQTYPYQDEILDNA